MLVTTATGLIACTAFTSWTGVQRPWLRQRLWWRQWHWRRWRRRRWRRRRWRHHLLCIRRDHLQQHEPRHVLTEPVAAVSRGRVERVRDDPAGRCQLMIDDTEPSGIEAADKLKSGWQT